ncbi:tyrosine-protein phosphatase [Fictibacillus gelatini]|uniref:tyrosine-protein phosphatase n=1 Tax=Fictibacillus gelatini TaxID=225985 RepID=UPI000415D054|nr:CpsB/CapC family capsule biosynthesis tyrosine phosphatase [Fictibacillus gelatini]
MIDSHCHILPGIDDGAQTINDSLMMARHAANEGITKIIATPHHRNGQYVNTKLDILKYVELLNEKLNQENIPLTILPGQETRIHTSLLDGFDSDELLTLNDTGKYLFVELPSNHVPKNASQLFYELLLKGVTPIIVHPERNSELMEKPDLLFHFVKEGVLTQITSSSIIGKFGKKIKSFTEKILEHQLTHFIASDAHNISTRSFHLRGAYDYIEKQFGTQTRYYFQENAEQMVLGQTILVEDPQPIKKKKLFGIF